jgi:hypothetical protein
MWQQDQPLISKMDVLVQLILSAILASATTGSVLLLVMLKELKCKMGAIVMLESLHLLLLVCLDSVLVMLAQPMLILPLVVLVQVTSNVSQGTATCLPQLQT